jgi:hypothetical protein
MTREQLERRGGVQLRGSSQVALISEAIDHRARDDAVGIAELAELTVDADQRGVQRWAGRTPPQVCFNLLRGPGIQVAVEVVGDMPPRIPAAQRDPGERFASFGAGSERGDQRHASPSQPLLGGGQADGPI